MQGQTKRS